MHIVWCRRQPFIPIGQGEIDENRIRIGVIGCGLIGQMMHLPT